MKFITPRSVIAATIVAGLVAGGTVSVVGLDRYLTERHLAEQSLSDTAVLLAGLAEQVTEEAARANALDAQATAAVASATGQTAADEPLERVRKAQAELRGDSATVRSALQDAQQALPTVQRAFPNLLWWPPNATSFIASHIAVPDVSLLKRSVDQLRLALAQLTAAQAAWQAEQDRIAAEQAAAEQAAAAERAARKAAASNISSSGGDTAPTAPELPAEPVPSVTAADIEAYLHALEPRAIISWDPNLCREGTICGITQLGSEPPTIVLDTDLQNYYLTDTGKYVLVHEAAHARSWYRYGSISALGTASVAVTGIAPSGPSDPGRAAIEWMADCATIVKLGYSLGAYTTGCTAPQLAEAATYW